jgi:hypothetical protein
MKRLLLILAAIVVTGGIAAAPAVAGLAGNPSFSHQIPVPAPSKAQQPSFADDHGRDGAVTTPVSTASKSTATAHPEPGDDRGGATSTSTRPACATPGCPARCTIWSAARPGTTPRSSRRSIPKRPTPCRGRSRR